MIYSLGLDIGITSVGWAVLNHDDKRIENLGVRAFEKAEHPKTGASLALPRRLARGARRRIRRRRVRMQDIKKLLIKQEMIDKSFAVNMIRNSFEKSPWELRKEALERSLTKEEFARILLHMAKRRGFKSNKKNSEVKDSSDEGKLLSGVKFTTNLVKSYQTIGEMFASDPEFKDKKRNSSNEYKHTVDRKLLQSEIEEIFKAQRSKGCIFAGENFEKEYLEIWSRQKPFASKEFIEKLIGKCTLEKDEKRAPKACYTSERFNLLQKINNLKIGKYNSKEPFTKEQRDKIIELAYRNKKVTFTRIRKEIKMEEEFTFNVLSYGRKERNKVEDTTFIELKAWHVIKEIFLLKFGEDYWNNLSKNEDKLNQIGYACTIYKTDEDIKDYLVKNGFSLEEADCASSLDFSKVQHLSVKAMKKLNPLLEQGLTFYETCEKAGYSSKEAGKRQIYLPNVPIEELTNPVVIRALTQARKLINAIIRLYGSPVSVHIELARELSRNFKDRNDMRKKQEENQYNREKAKEDFKERFDFEGKGTDILKWQLYREQQSKCLYTLKEIELDRLFEPGYVEIDHILPHSRTFDDSRDNKALVLGGQNRQKGNRIPYEYFGEDQERWAKFEAFVGHLDIDRKKKENLLRKSLTREETEDFKERNLNDTRYISRYLKNFIEDNLLFTESESKKKVYAVSGHITAFLRYKWGIKKDREENDLHHAADAAVVASVSDSMIKRISDASKRNEFYRMKVSKSDIDQETGQPVESVYHNLMEKTRYPEPWNNFSEEIKIRTSLDMETRKDLYPEDFLKKIKPIFVSRMPQRGVTGSAHKDTVRSRKILESEGVTYVKTPLGGLKSKDIEDMKDTSLYRSDRLLYEALLKKLKENNDDPKKAFAETFYKPKSDGTPGPIVHSVKIASTEGISGIEINNGIAAKDNLVRIDVFEKSDKKGKKQYFIVPIYVADMAKRTFPDKAITANKPEKEWTVIDDSFQFLFSLYSNDLVEVILENNKYFGYYKGCDRKTGTIKIMRHYKNDDSLSDRPGIKTAKSVEKYEVDFLGNYYRVGGEKRQPLPGIRRKKDGLAESLG